MSKEIFYTKKNTKDLNIAIISDIHYYTGFNKKIFNSIIKQLQNNKPDYITIVGDILDTSTTYDLIPLGEFLKEISQISPVIAILGNHDEKTGYMRKWEYEPNEELIKLLNSIPNIHLLNDQSKTFDNITFTGLRFSFQYYEKKHETYESFCDEMKDKTFNLSEENYNITLIHSPINIYTYLSKNKNHQLTKSDLILSGHMHNGCLPYWFTNLINKVFKTTRSIISPTRKFFPKYAQGRIYERDGYVYEGISKFSKSTKIFHNLDIFYHKKVKFIIIKKH